MLQANGVFVSPAYAESGIAEALFAFFDKRGEFTQILADILPQGIFFTVQTKLLCHIVNALEKHFDKTERVDGVDGVNLTYVGDVSEFFAAVKGDFVGGIFFDNVSAFFFDQIILPESGGIKNKIIIILLISTSIETC